MRDKRERLLNIILSLEFLTHPLTAYVRDVKAFGKLKSPEAALADRLIP